MGICEHCGYEICRCCKSCRLIGCSCAKTPNSRPVEEKIKSLSLRDQVRSLKALRADYAREIERIDLQLQALRDELGV